MKKKVINIFKNENKIALIGIVMIVIFTVSFFVSYQYEWKNAIEMPHVIEDEGEITGNNIELTGDNFIEQSIKLKTDEMTGISIYLGTVDKKCKEVSVKLIDENKKKVGEWNINKKNVKDGYYELPMDKEKKKVKDEEYKLEINIKSDGKIKIPTCKQEIKSSVLRINGIQDKKEIIGYKIINGTHTGLKYFAIAVWCGVIGCFTVGIRKMIQKKEKSKVFVSIAMLLGILYMFSLAPFSIPDEYAHFATAYAQSSMLMGKDAVDENGNVLMEENIWKRGHEVTKDSYVEEVYGFFQKGNNGNIISTRTMLSGVQLGYIPQVIGITLARVCGAGAIQIIMAGRFCALLFYCLSMFWAIRIMPCNKEMLMIIGLFPMTLQQVMSYSYDSILIDASFVLIALIVSKIVKKNKIKKSEIALMIIIIMIISSLKFVYLPILLLSLYIEPIVFDNKKSAYALGTILLSGCVVLGTRLITIQEAIKSTDVYSIKTISLGYCINNPIAIFELLWRTLERVSSDYLGQMISSPLGYLDIGIPNIILIAFIILFIGSALQSENSEIILKKNIKRMSLLIFFSIGLLIMIALMLSWTPLDATLIQGVQGRYFIPVLPLIGIAMQNRTIVIRKDISSYLILGAMFFNVYTIYFVALSGISK